MVIGGFCQHTLLGILAEGGIAPQEVDTVRCEHY